MEDGIRKEKRQEARSLALEYLKEYLGPKVAKLRKEKGWSQEELSNISGVATTVISRIENGSAIVSLSMLAAIAHAFGLPLYEFLKIENENPVVSIESLDCYDLYINGVKLKKREASKIANIIENIFSLHQSLFESNYLIKGNKVVMQILEDIQRRNKERE